MYFNKNGGVDKKTYLNEVKQGKIVGSYLSFKDVGSTHQSNEELANLISKGKSTNLIKTLVKIANSTSSDIILDFFAGSGTTAHAVMSLNVEDTLTGSSTDANLSRKY